MKKIAKYLKLKVVFILLLFNVNSHACSENSTALMDIINDFSHIISRRIDPVETATLSIGKIQGGERYNVIAKAVDGKMPAD